MTPPYWPKQPWGLERYHNDPEFHQLVCGLEYFLADGKFSIGELKQALTIAAIKFETQRLPRLRLSPRDTAAILSNPDFEHLANEVLR